MTTAWVCGWNLKKKDRTLGFCVFVLSPAVGSATAGFFCA
jgi:hypothetical protein